MAAPVTDLQIIYWPKSSICPMCRRGWQIRVRQVPEAEAAIYGLCLADEWRCRSCPGVCWLRGMRPYVRRRPKGEPRPKTNPRRPQARIAIDPTPPAHEPIRKPGW